MNPIQTIIGPQKPTKCLPLRGELSRLEVCRWIRKFADQGLSAGLRGCFLSNNLATYLRVRKIIPGESQKLKKGIESFWYLDDFWKFQLKITLIFRMNQNIISLFIIPLIHCCFLYLVCENLYQIHSGVVSSRVDFWKRSSNQISSRIKFSLKRIG